MQEPSALCATLSLTNLASLLNRNRMCYQSERWECYWAANICAAPLKSTLGERHAGVAWMLDVHASGFRHENLFEPQPHPYSSSMCIGASADRTCARHSAESMRALDFGARKAQTGNVWTLLSTHRSPDSKACDRSQPLRFDKSHGGYSCSFQLVNPPAPPTLRPSLL